MPGAAEVGKEVAASQRPAASGLTALPEPVLRDILARMPGNDTARAMGACRALAAAVRSMPEIGLDLDLYMSSGMCPHEYMSAGTCNCMQARPSLPAGVPRSFLGTPPSTPLPAATVILLASVHMCGYRCTAHASHTIPASAAIRGGIRRTRSMYAAHPSV